MNNESLWCAYGADFSLGAETWGAVPVSRRRERHCSKVGPDIGTIQP